MMFKKNQELQVNPYQIQEEQMESALPSLCVKEVLDNSLEELNQLYTKTSKNTEESSGGCEEVMMDSDIGPNSKIWNEAEIKKLFTFYEEFGSRWTTIAKMIEGKPENSIKNKFNCSIRKFTRKLNKINKKTHTQFRKEIRTESVFRIIEATQLFPNMEEEMKKKSLEIRSMILFEAQKEEEAECSQNVIDLIDAINGFNLKTRSHKNPKHKRKKEIILFGPDKELTKTNNAGQSKSLSIKKNAFSVQLCVEELSVKGDDQNCDLQDISLEDKQSSSAHLNTFLTELESQNNDQIIPFPDDFLGNENRDCYLNSIFNSEEFHTFDHNEWFHQ